MTPREHAARLAAELFERVMDDDEFSVTMALDADREQDRERSMLLRVKSKAAALRADLNMRIADAYQAVADGEEPAL